MNGNLLKKTLDSLYENRSRVHLANDPLSFCHWFDNPRDQEIVGLIASSFAYGNVKIILRNLEFIFSRMSESPRRFIENFDPQNGLTLFSGFKHRFNDARDLCALLYAIRLMITDSGTIENFFRKGVSAESGDNSTAMEVFAAKVLGFDYSPVFGTPTPPEDSYFSFLFPSPASGSACKRLCMYLRWMVRPADGIDLGIWKSAKPSQLIIPVDAHIQRICRQLGFTVRKQADWKMACEITAALKALDSDDPVKYDFSICHLGISEGCSGRQSEKCCQCPISSICSREW